MKWKNQGHELDEIAEQICDLNVDYYIWGTANIANHVLDLCEKDIRFVGAIDSNRERQGESIHGLLIEAPDILKKNHNCKIVIASSAYAEIKKMLDQMGYTENIQYYDYFMFLQIVEMYKKGKLYSRRLDISLTERCTLKCKKCNMFMPYFKQPSDLDVEDVLNQIDYYFQIVDYVESLNLLGGEPFLYQQLEEVVSYIGKNYRDKAEHVKIFTNGMLLPKHELLKVIHDYDVEVQISNYTAVVPYEKRIAELTALLDNYQVKYYMFQDAIWGDFGFPENPNEVSEENLITYFEGCKAPFRGLYQNRVYYCHLETSAIRAGMYEDNSNDYFDLLQQTEEIKKKFLEFDFGYSIDGAVSFCRKCRGCGKQNGLTVPAAEQI